MKADSRRKKNLKKDTLKSVHMLIADGDNYMAGVLSQNLATMGFGATQHVKNGEEVLKTLQTQPFDVLITEWPMAPVDGIELVKQLRRDPDVARRTIPIIMLTGQAEKADVEAARDAGITEFVIKPFAVNTLFSRLEQVIEHPRGFLLSTGYIGPDRRRRQDAPPAEERRLKAPTPTHAMSLSPTDDFSAPKLLPPDAELKRKISLTEPLSDIITPEILQEAQATLDSMADESLVWIKKDLSQLEAAARHLAKGNVNDLKLLKDSALSIKSRAGTFGYHLASEVARLLYRFASSRDYQPNVAHHNTIVLKHIEALKIIIARKVTGKDNELSNQMTKELEMLAAKHRA